MGKKKFIDKKKSATFQLLARDTSTLPAAANDAASPSPAVDRVFVRVDNNPYACPAIFDDNEDEGDAHPDSIFADAPGDTDDDEGSVPLPWIAGGGAPRLGKERALARAPSRSLPDHVRREILELGFPDDGYNYLIHLREIKNGGAGSYYYENSKATPNRVPLDVKAYDASKLWISSDEVGDDDYGDSMYAVASKTRGVKVQKAVDPEVVRLLDGSDLSQFGSDVEELEEDFVVKANRPDKEEDQIEELEEEGAEEEILSGEQFGLTLDSSLVSEPQAELVHMKEEDQLSGVEKPRVRRLLDEQFDLLTLREYDNDSDSDDGHYIETERELLNNKLKNALKQFTLDDLEFQNKNGIPGDIMHSHEQLVEGAELDASPEVIRRCAEYAERYLNGSHDDDEVVYVEESSDESEVWDCETIVSTYSNLDNHPGKIQAPENLKKRFSEAFSGNSVAKDNLIALRGREKLPFEYLPHKKRTAQKVKTADSSGAEKPKKKPQGQESKEEKKERKAAVKEERREARKAKKELKGLYKGESQRAQKVAAISGPSSVHLK